ncbi:radical SAM protein [Bacteroidia bacterium]|nr:radical SAM protein [Bacteroidia bacterium]
MLINIWIVGLIVYRNPKTSYFAVKQMFKQFKNAAQGFEISQGIYNSGRYTWDMFNPSWPSNSFNRFYKTHLREYHPIENSPSILRRILVAITKKCPLQCEHCSEWDTLNEKDHMTFEDICGHLDRFVAEGAAQLVYSGGEPLNRYSDLVKLIKRYNGNCDQWVYSSGYNLTQEKAYELASAGLNGIAISLDHQVEELHNLFRGNQKSFLWVKKALEHCKEAGLLVSINSCLTKEYIKADGFDDLVNLLSGWGVPILNIIEPRAVGHYANKEVELSISEQQYLETKVMHYNSAKIKGVPVVLYPAMFRKGLPCGGGRSYLFLDSDGTLLPCPFCRTPITNHLEVSKKCEADKMVA